MPFAFCKFDEYLQRISEGWSWVVRRRIYPDYNITRYPILCRILIVMLVYHRRSCYHMTLLSTLCILRHSLVFTACQILRCTLFHCPEFPSYPKFGNILCRWPTNCISLAFWLDFGLPRQNMEKRGIGIAPSWRSQASFTTFPSNKHSFRCQIFSQSLKVSFLPYPLLSQPWLPLLPLPLPLLELR